MRGVSASTHAQSPPHSVQQTSADPAAAPVSRLRSRRAAAQRIAAARLLRGQRRRSGAARSQSPCAGRGPRRPPPQPRGRRRDGHRCRSSRRMPRASTGKASAPGRCAHPQHHAPRRRRPHQSRRRRRRPPPDPPCVRERGERGRPASVDRARVSRKRESARARAPQRHRPLPAQPSPPTSTRRRPQSRCYHKQPFQRAPGPRAKGTAKSTLRPRATKRVKLQRSKASEISDSSTNRDARHGPQPAARPHQKSQHERLLATTPPPPRDPCTPPPHHAGSPRAHSQ